METPVSTQMDDGFKKCTAKRKSFLILNIIHGKATVAEASRGYYLSLSKLEAWVEEGKKGMENTARIKSLEIKKRYGLQLREMQPIGQYTYAP